MVYDCLNHQFDSPEISSAKGPPWRPWLNRFRSRSCGQPAGQPANHGGFDEDLPGGSGIQWDLTGYTVINMIADGVSEMVYSRYSVFVLPAMAILKRTHDDKHRMLGSIVSHEPMVFCGIFWDDVPAKGPLL